MYVGLLLLIVGIVVLTYAADAFVDGSVAISQRFEISPVVVGALVIGFGTSLPEMLVSGVAAAQGDADLGVGNVIGSNVANLTLVLGLAALISVVGADTACTRRELPICVGSVLAFALFVQGGFTRWEGAVLLAAMLATLVVLVRGSHDQDQEFDHSDDAAFGRTAAITIAGLVGTVGGAWMLVRGALEVADGLGLTGGFIGLTMVAIGTSLPEMVTAVVAARKGETDLIIGNLLGSNIFNSLAVGAVLGLVGPGPLEDANLAGLATLLMIIVVGLAAVFLLTNGSVGRRQATILLLLYFVTMPFTASADIDCAEEPDAAECVDEVTQGMPKS